MKKFFKTSFVAVVLQLFLSISVFADEGHNVPPTPPRFEISLEQNGCEGTVVVKAILDAHNHIYSMRHDPDKADGSGQPTEIVLEGNPSFSLNGGLKERQPMKVNDASGESLWFENKSTWKQKIKVNSSNNFKIKGYVSYMVCTNMGCLPPTYYDFVIDVNGCEEGAVIESPIVPNLDTVSANLNIGATGELEIVDCPAGWVVRAKELGNKEYEILVQTRLDSNWVIYGNNSIAGINNLELSFGESDLYAYTSETEMAEANTVYDSLLGKELLVYNNKATFVRKIKLTSDSIPVLKGNISFSSSNGKVLAISDNAEFNSDLKKAQKLVEDESSPKSYWTIFIFAFLAGFTALLTPCVFPMIPMTVSFFTKQSKSKAAGVRNAIIYGLSIVVIYVALGLGITLAFGPEALNDLSTNVIFNIFFFILLVVFGASFLGAFEITLPASWVNKADKKADKGGLVGIFFMAFTLSLVSFSCTGPIIGTLLVEAVSKGVMGPFFGMLGFSLALALPFALFAAFPGWLNSMPQSGGWLNSVKVVLGFLEIALAFKFLSNADLVVQAHLLERELFLAIWIVIFSLMGFYLLGKLQFSHDSPLPFINVTRLFMATLVFSFVVYMLPGMWGAPVKMLSGFLPPQNYSEIPFGIGGHAPEGELPEGGHHGPHGIMVFHDYDEGFAYAREKKLPVMLDFTGLACINCRKMEDLVWADEKIKPILDKEVVIISLYVDEKTKLSSPITAPDGTVFTAKGDKWKYMQKTKYGQLTQPQYIMLDLNEEKLNKTISYDPSGDLVGDFKAWMDASLEEFESRQNEIVVRPSTFIYTLENDNSIPTYNMLKEKFEADF